MVELPDLNVAILHNIPSILDTGSEPSEIDVLDQVEGVKKSLQKLNIPLIIIPVTQPISTIIDTLMKWKPTVVFNLCENVYGISSFEMNIPCLLELLRIPYTGSSPITLGLCQNKDLAKAILATHGVPTPRYRVIQKSVEDEKIDLQFPLVVKPVHEDGSLGITEKSLVANYHDLVSQVENVIKTYRQPALVEECVGGREFNVSLLGNNPPTLLPISEVMFKGEGRIVDYNAKWIRWSKSFKETPSVCPAELDTDVRVKIEDIAIRSYEYLHCRDYARVDIRLSREIPYVLEVNPNPDISPEAGYTRSLLTEGLNLENFVEKVIGYALSRENYV